VAFENESEKVDESKYVEALGMIEEGGDCKNGFRILHELALSGYIPAANCVGTLYSGGIGVAKDTHEALRWWRKAAAQDDVGSMLNIGTEYRDSIRNLRRAKFWLNRAARTGDSQGYLELARLYCGIDKSKHGMKIRSYLEKALSAVGLLSEDERQQAEKLRDDLASPRDHESRE